MTAITARAPSLAHKVALAVAGSLLIAVAAKVSVPFYPVPMSLQTLAVLLVGFALGARLGAATVLLYLAQGAAGLPVFTPTTAPGLAAFAGPTAGFLVGFVGMAWIAGLASDATRRALPLVGAGLAASALLYVPGLAWPLGLAALAGVSAGWATLAPDAVLGAFAMPFLAGDAVKAVLAALVAAGALRALAR